MNAFFQKFRIKKTMNPGNLLIFFLGMILPLAYDGFSGDLVLSEARYLFALSAVLSFGLASVIAMDFNELVIKTKKFFIYLFIFLLVSFLSIYYYSHLGN